MSDRPVERPLHLRPSAIALVVAGGTLGTAGREGVALLLPPVAGLPVAVLAVNLVGALLLGALLEALVRRGPDRGGRRVLRLLFGTGMMGGFTTYSALSTDTAALVGAGSGWLAIGYGLATVLIGALATAAGIAIGRALHERREERG